MYVDDLAVISKDPKAITNTLMNKYNFKLKGTGEIEYHLGMSFCRNDQKELCISPQQYIEKMVDNYKRLFGESPLHCSQSPLESNDHPEINSSEFLSEDDIQKYQSLIWLCNGPSALGVLILRYMS
jgi:hypothetical protein